MKKCSGCVKAVLVDSGYSNWTVMGTDVYCSLDLNPEAPFDAWYGKDGRDLFAETCPKFGPDGPGLHMDCEREDVDALTDDEAVLWALVCAQEDGPS